MLTAAPFGFRTAFQLCASSLNKTTTSWNCKRNRLASASIAVLAAVAVQLATLEIAFVTLHSKLAANTDVATCHSATRFIA